MNTELQNNSPGHLRRTLEDFSSVERQSLYKAKVPFVHVPHELLAQWDGHMRLLREAKWFRALFDVAQVAALENFDALVNRAAARFDNGLPDVPEILEHGDWRDLASHAVRLSELLPLDKSDDAKH